MSVKMLQLQLLIASVNEKYATHDCPFELLLEGIRVISDTARDFDEYGHNWLRHNNLEANNFPEIVTATLHDGTKTRMNALYFLEDIFERMTDFNFPSPKPAPAPATERWEDMTKAVLEIAKRADRERLMCADGRLSVGDWLRSLIAPAPGV